MAAKKKKKVRRASAGSVDAMAFLEKLTGGPLAFARFIQESLEVFAKRLGVSRGHLCDIEKGRRGVSVARASEWAKALGYHEWQFVSLALQADLDAAGIKLRVKLEAA